MYTKAIIKYSNRTIKPILDTWGPDKLYYSILFLLQQLAQVLPAHRASRTSVESASSLSGKRAAVDHPPAVTTTATTVAKGDSKTDMSPPPKIPSKQSVSGSSTV